MSSSTKPYMIRALHQWCCDNGHTPYLVVWVNDHTDVPREYVKNNEIVLNVAYSATKNLQIENDWISFSARFGGMSRDIWVPVGNVMSIFARETGEGMGFEVEPMPEDAALKPAPSVDQPKNDGDDPGPSRPSGGRPSLRIVK